jgi:hypothetical protein
MSLFPEDYLSGYLDHQSLQPDERQHVENALEHSPELRADYRSLLALKQRLHTSADALRKGASVENSSADAWAALQERVLNAAYSQQHGLENLENLESLENSARASPSHAEAAPRIVVAPASSTQSAQSAPAALAPAARASVSAPAPTLKHKRFTQRVPPLVWLAAASVAIAGVVYGGSALNVFSIFSSGNLSEETLSTGNAPTAVTAAANTVEKAATTTTTKAAPTLALDFRQTALQNFKAVTGGSIQLACKTGSFDELKKFFVDNGITFTLIKPSIRATLVGGVISTENGEKSVHLVYRKGNTIVYMWQIAEHEIQLRSTTVNTLHEPTSVHVEQAITHVIHDNGKWYWENHHKASEPTFAVWEDKSTLCVVMAAMPQRSMQPLFQ